MHLLSVNDIIKYSEKILFRVLWIDEENKYIYVIDLNKDKPLPRRLYYSDVVNDIEEESAVKLIDNSYSIYINENELTEIEIKGRNNAWNAIEDIVNIKNYPDIFNERERGKIIDNVLKKKNISKPYIYKCLRRYWIGGQTKNSLIPRYNKCGGKGIEKNLKDKKIGRPRIYKEITGEGINITDDIKRIIDYSIKIYYNKKSKLTLNQAYKKMIQNYFSETSIDIDKDGKEILKVKESKNIPTLGQFKYRYYKNRNLKEEIESRNGEKDYEMNHRAILNNSMYNIVGPGSQYQIDATIADIYLVSRFDRSKIVGRPTMYFVIDTYSRMFVGLYIGYESPSWVGAMMALSNAACDKVKFSKQFGINIKEEDWNVKGIPEVIIGDRGEMEGTSVESLINSFGIDIQNTPAYRPDWKGIVEQRFNIIQSSYKPIVPGAVRKDFMKRGGKDYRLDATLDIYEFTQIIIKYILKYNNTCLSSDYIMDPQAVKDGIAPIPSKIWDWGVRNRNGILRTVSEELMKLNVMPVGKATVTKEGIKFKKILYTCPTGESQNWFVEARYKGTWKINVSYDPRNMTHIYIKDEKNRQFETCTIKQSHKVYANKSLAEIELLKSEKKKLELKNEENNLNVSINLYKDVEDIISEAQKKNEKFEHKYESKSQKIKNIRKNKKEEKDKIRQEEAFILAKESETINMTNEEVEEVYTFESKEAELLSYLQEELFGDD